jgi:hypothetical protein
VLVFGGGSGTTLIYDKKLPNILISSGTFAYNLTGVPAGSSTLMTMVGADGQVGGGFDSAVTAETTSVNGTLIAGPGSARGDGHWNGADGNPLPQLWDTSTQDVSSLNGGNGKLAVQETTTGDCLVPIVDVLTVQ